MIKMTFGFILSAVLAGTSLPVYAAVIFYTNETDFLAAAGTSDATMTFEGVAPADSLVGAPTPYTENDITLTELGLIIDEGYNSGIYDVGTGASGQIYREVASTATYAGGPVYSGGATVFTVQASGDHAIGTANIGLSSGETGSVTTSNVNGESFFIGFVSDTPVVSFDLFANTTTIDFNARWLEVDNILVSTTAPPSLPIINTIWLFSLGLPGLLLATRKRKSAVHP